MPKFLSKFWSRLPPPAAMMLGQVGSLAVGLLIAGVLHYLCYRIGLPSKPFIYVAF